MRSFAAWLLLAVAACSSTSPSPATIAADAGTDSGAVDAAPARTEACLAQDRDMQAALDGARKSPNAMIAVRNTDCGTTVYVSGDSAKANASSLWRIGSVTKTYVSAAILSLVAEGKLSLDDALDKWVPNVPKTAGVTVRMLLNHRSGIFNYTEDQSFFADRKRKWQPRELVDLATTHDPYFAPGAGFHYSNTNYILLGMVLESAAGAKAGAALRARVIGRAGLKHTFFDGEDTVDGALARGYRGAVDVTEVSDMSGPWTAGAMVASGGDLADWVYTLYGTDQVLDATRRELLTGDASSTPSGVRYGLGVMLVSGSRSPAGPGMGHDGSIDGFRTMAFYFPDRKTAIAAVTNQDGSDVNALLVTALETLFK